MIERTMPSRSVPAAVRWVFLPTCSKSGTPAFSSSFLIWPEIAGCVRCSSSAARAKLRCRATDANTLSWRSVACFNSASAASMRHGLAQALAHFVDRGGERAGVVGAEQVRVMRLDVGRDAVLVAGAGLELLVGAGVPVPLETELA